MTTPHAQPPVHVTTSGDAPADGADAAHGDGGAPAGHAGRSAGHDDDLHGAVVLGPVDWVAWTTGALGVALGLIVALCLVLATSVIAPAA